MLWHLKNLTDECFEVFKECCAVFKALFAAFKALFAVNLVGSTSFFEVTKMTCLSS